MPQFLTERERQDNQERLGLWKILVVSAFVLISGQFAILQGVESDQWAMFAENSQIRQVTIPSTRGDIYDRNRRLLADWRQSFNVTVIPAYLNDEAVQILARVLSATPELLKDLIKKNGRWSPFLPITVAEGLDWETFARVEENRLVMPGVDTEVRPMRRYAPGVELISHVLGYMGEIGGEELGRPGYKKIYRMGDYIGKAGVERSLESTLRGRDGVAIKLVDALGREISADPGAGGGKSKPMYFDKLKALDAMSRPQTPGQSVVLTIDLRLQAIVRDALGDNVGSAVVMDVKTGELLAIVSKPDFDPNFFIGTRDPQVWAAIRDNPFKPMYNRAVLGAYPPGSIFKIVMAAAGIEEGIITTNTKVECTGKFEYKGSTFRCWNRTGHGTVNLERALAESCDVYFYELGEKLGIDTIARWARKFGLGAKTGIHLPEDPGLVPTREWSLEEREKVWYPGETINVSIGQGLLLTTPLQAALMAAAVANHGVLMEPRLIHHLEDINRQPTTRFAAQPYPRVMSPRTAAIIARAMEKVVNDSRGTAYKYVHSDVVKIAGKTGTAQVSSKYYRKPIDETPYKYRDHSWFVAYAPADEPEIAVVVMIEHGGSGGAIAGVIAKRIIESYVRLNDSARNPAGPGGG